MTKPHDTLYCLSLNCGRGSMVELELPKLLHYRVQFFSKSLSDLATFNRRLSFYQAHGMKDGKNRSIFIWVQNQC